MKTPYKTAVAAAFVAVVVLAAAAFGQTGSTPSPGAGPKKDGGGRHPGKRVVHSESKVQTADGFALLIVDNGEVTGVSGETVTIKRADGESVSATATEDTKIRRNGEDAQLSAFQTGDRASIMQVKVGDTTTVRAIRAFSKDFQPKHAKAAASFLMSASRFDCSDCTSFPDS